MIPVKLTLKNFMSYGEEPATLDFTGIHLASLSGDNGNGKSALLDAMTYALWGKTRASAAQSSGEEDLIRLGADDMEVQLEFKLDEDIYRATRRRNRRTRSGDWQLHLMDGSGEWRPAGGSTMADTGRAIARLLRMEYETFLNSAYVQQGRADEFTRQKPNDRKRILGDILDLSRYDRLEEMARDRRGACELALKDLEGEIRHLESRAAEGIVAAERLEAAENAASEAAALRAEAAKRHEICTSAMASLETRAAQAREAELRLRDVELALAQIEQRIARTQAEQRRVSALIEQADSVREDAKRLVAARAEVDRLQPSINRLHAAKQERATTQARVDLARQELLRELDRAEREVRRGEERLRQIAEIDRRLADIGPKLAHFQKAHEERQVAQAELERTHERFTSMAADSRKIKAEISEAEEILELLSVPKPACPVCASDLSGGKRQVVVIKQESRLALLRERLVEVNREGLTLKRDREALKQHVDTLEEQIRSEAALRAQSRELASSRERLCAENEEHDSNLAIHESVRASLAANDFSAEDRKQIEALEAEIARLDGKARDYTAATRTVRDLTDRGVEERHAALQRAEQELEALVRDIGRMAQDRADLVRRVEEARRSWADLAAETDGLERARNAVAEAAIQLQRAAGEYEAASTLAARCRQTVEDCARAAELLIAKRTDRDRLAKEKQAYTDLAAAFSRRGVQAHIIDNALPEVQEEANRLLSRLTDNAMQITLSTLRQAKTTSSQIETLDISITDDAGTRPYEMFSGGEAFRVNFALRIALSRLLARRAGASLQTLILDEGFGTQDAKGRERLVEAIETVKDEFALILVISHIEDLKDAFPTRIEVTKTSAGSQVALVE